MKNIMLWIKSNFITAISVVVVIVAIIFIFYFHSKGSELTEHIKSQSGVAARVTGYLHQSVQIPSATATEKPRALHNVVVNKKLIDLLKGKYKQMDDKRKQLFAFISKVNKDGHTPFIDNLFPDAQSARVLFDARDAYKKAIKNMAASLNAGMPLSKDAMEEVVKHVDLAVKQERQNSNRKSSLSEYDIRKILQRKRVQLIKALQDRAGNISIYADATDSLQDNNYIYTVDKWPFAGTKPTMSQVWEGQMELWVQQDITKVINTVNNNLQGKKSSGGHESSVINNPIKRLIGMRVVPGYVGLHTRGVVPIAQSQQQVIDNMSKLYSRGINSNDKFLSSRRGYGNSDNQRQNSDGSYPPPVNNLRTNDPAKVASKNFYISTTGRTSNSSYDVRQVKLSLIVDYTQLPKIINAFSKVNFMTVIFCNLHKIDVHDALVNGYYYGKGDIVRVDMVVESLWFRDWTRKLMPQKVRKYLGIDKY